MAKKDWMITESDLDDEQIIILNTILDKSCIVSGCAGSGKSVLALIKAHRIQKEQGPNYQIIVFTKTLASFMKMGKSYLGLKGGFHYHEEWRWKRFLKHYRNGQSFEVYERDDEGNRIANMPHSDFILVDEIQDFSETEITEFANATDKYFYFFGDTAQTIFSFRNGERTVPVEDINDIMVKEGKAKAKIFYLFKNHRLPLPVAKVVQYVGVGLEKFEERIYKSKETEIPRFVKASTEEQQSQILKTIINKNTDVGILCPTLNELNVVHNILNKNNISHEIKLEDKENFKNNIDTLDFSTELPKLMTYHCAKGLQFGTVILPNVVDTSNEYGRKTLYVAMTRTYRNLYVMYNDSLPYPLSTIPTELYKTTLFDEIEDK